MTDPETNTPSDALTNPNTDASPLSNDELAQQLLGQLVAQGANLNIGELPVQNPHTGNAAGREEQAQGTHFAGSIEDGSAGDSVPNQYPAQAQGQTVAKASDEEAVTVSAEADFFAALNALRRAKHEGTKEQVREAEAHLQQVVRAELRGEDTHGA